MFFMQIIAYSFNISDANYYFLFYLLCMGSNQYLYIFFVLVLFVQLYDVNVA